MIDRFDKAVEIAAGERPERQIARRPCETPQRAARWIFVSLCAAFSFYAGVFIAKTSFVFEGTRYFTLFDDIMIGMRYARNLVHHGQLVWNLGERVEGFTNPLWVFYLAVLHLLPVPQSKLSLLVQITGFVLLVCTAWVVYELARYLGGGSSFPGLAATAFTLFYYPLVSWSLQGFEVSLLTFLLASAAWALIRAQATGRFSVAPYLLLAGGVFTRIDGAIPFVGLLCYAAISDPRHRRKHLLTGGMILFAAVASLELARWLYYGEWLPNTYFQKLAGIPLTLRIHSGLYATMRLLLQLSPALILLSLIPSLFARRKAATLLTLLVILQFMYSIFVGGDSWELFGGANRYISIVMPLYFILLGCGIGEIFGAVAGRLVPSSALRTLALPVWQVSAVLCCLTVMNVSVSTGAADAGRWFLASDPPDVPELQQHARLGLVLPRLAAPDAKIAVVWAGALPYFADRIGVDLLGRCDKAIAREPMKQGRRLLYPGHVKWDYPYSLSVYAPDIVVELWDHPEQAKPLLDAHYTPVKIYGFTIYLLNSSSKIDWQAITSVSHHV